MNTYRRLTLQYDPSTDVTKDQKATDLKSAIGLNKKVLKILGLWSYSKESQWQTIRSNFLTIFFLSGIFIFVTFPQTLALIKVWGDLTLVIDNLIINLPTTTSLFKVIISWSKKIGS